MSKSIILNRVNGKNRSFTLPCDHVDATAFATAVLDGEYNVYKYGIESGAETETTWNEMQIMVKNSTTKEKTYLNLKIKANKSEADVFAALIGLTVNGITIDEAFIISDRLITA